MRNTEGYILIIFAGVLYGSIPIFATLLANLDVSTMEQIFVRLLLSVIAFLIFFRSTKKGLPKLEKRDYFHFFLFGLVGIALFFSLYMSAAVMIGVTITVLLLYTQPIYTLILSRLILHARIGLWGIAAIVFSMAGIAIIFKIWSMQWEKFGLGYIFGLCTGLLYTVYIIFMRVYSRKYNSPTITFWAFLFGLLWLIPLWLVFRILSPIAEMTALKINLEPNAWLLLLGFTIIPTLLAYLIFNRGMKYVEPHRAGVLVLSEPLSAIIMSLLILGQPIFFTDLLGGALILVSFLLLKLDRNAQRRI